MQNGNITLSHRFIKLISESLFGNSPVIAIRELIQNAHDAVLIRAIQEPTVNPPHTWGVAVEIDPTNSTICMTDTGIGMDKLDVTEKLAVLGVTSKDQELLEKKCRTAIESM